jgi:hypothetical protein
VDVIRKDADQNDRGMRIRHKRAGSVSDFVRHFNRKTPIAVDRRINHEADCEGYNGYQHGADGPGNSNRRGEAR